MLASLLLLLHPPAIAGPEPFFLTEYATGELLVLLPDGGRAGEDGTLRLLQASPGLAEVIRKHQLRFRPWLDVPEREVDGVRARAASRSGVRQPDLLAWVVATPAEGAQLVEVAADLAAIPGIRHVAAVQVAIPPPADLEPTTPSFEARQGYLDPNPGIDARYAWAWGVTGAGVRLSDCEYGWHADHEDLVDGDLDPEPGFSVASEVASRGWDHHGTAVAGEIVAPHNGYGVSGIAPDVTFGMYSEWTVESGYNRGRAIFEAIADSEAGDVVLLEMQTGGPDGRLAPAEVDAAVYSLVKVGVDAGVIVVGAAGNGSADLDGAAYESYRARGDSGAIVVGAGSSNTSHGRLGFSSFGKRVNLQGWGENVFTTGYGGYARYGTGNLQTYTATFSGTSSASPIVAGAAALVVEAVGRYRWDPPAPRTVRDILVKTGTPGPPSSGIGPLPDLEAALAEVERRYDVLPEVLAVQVSTPAEEGSELTLDASYSALETLTTSWVWTLPDRTETGGAAARWVPPGDGVWPGVVQVTDSWGRVDEMAFEMVVQNRPPATPTLTRSGDLTEGSPVTFTASAVDPGNDPVVYRWTVQGETLSTTEATLTWTPEDNGSVPVIVVAEDDAGARSEGTWTMVTVLNRPPTVTIEGPTAGSRGELLNFVARVEDVDADSHRLSWDFGDGVSGAGPALAHAWRERGTFLVTLTVTDDDGGQTQVTHTVTVDRRSCGCTTGTPFVSAGGSALSALGGLLALWTARRRRSAARPSPR